jgi:hypothetical protein
MEERMIETLTRRLERVERTNRRLQGVGALGLAALAMVGVMGQTAPKQVPPEIQAEAFVVRDASGKVRVALNASLGLVLLDQAGKRRTSLTATGLNIAGSNEEPRVTIGAIPDGPVALLLWDQAGDVRAGLRLEDTGRPSLVLGDRAEKPRVMLGLPDAETARLTFHDRNGRTRASVTVSESGPGLTLLDEKGTARAVLGHVKLPGARPGVTEERPAASLVLFDQDGGAIRKVP